MVTIPNELTSWIKVSRIEVISTRWRHRCLSRLSHTNPREAHILSGQIRSNERKKKRTQYRKKVLQIASEGHAGLPQGEEWRFPCERHYASRCVGSVVLPPPVGPASPLCLPQSVAFGGPRCQFCDGGATLTTSPVRPVWVTTGSECSAAVDVTWETGMVMKPGPWTPVVYHRCARMPGWLLLVGFPCQYMTVELGMRRLRWLLACGPVWRIMMKGCVSGPGLGWWQLLELLEAQLHYRIRKNNSLHNPKKTKIRGKKIHSIMCTNISIPNSVKIRVHKAFLAC